MSRTEKQRRRQARRERHYRQRQRRQCMNEPLREKDQVVRFFSYEITEEALHLNAETDPRLESALADQREELFDLVYSDPRAAVPRLQKLMVAFPHSPLLLNWLSAAYQMAGMDAEYERTAKLNYQQNPNYLFARIAYAHLELHAGHPERVAEILENKFDLKLLYPWRNVFHVSEFISFTGLMIEYHFRQGEIEIAGQLYDTLAQVAPDHRITEQLGKLLNSPVTRFLEKVRQRMRGDKARRDCRLAAKTPSP